jgi:cytochrome c biogenesis protein CcdA
VKNLKTLIFGLFALMASCLLYAQGSVAIEPSLEFSPPEWKFGMITKGDIARERLVVANRGKSAENVTLIPTCTCLSVMPASRRIEAGSSASFELAYDSKDDEGKTSRGFIAKTGDSQGKPLYYLLDGVVRAERPTTPAGNAGAQGGASGTAWTSADSGIELRYYYTPGCRSCENFITKELPQLEVNYGVNAHLLRRDLLDPKAYEEFATAAKELGTSVTAIPALRIGNVLLQGDAEIESRLPGLLMVSRDAASGPPIPQPENGSAEKGASLALVPVLVAGLVDGFNPCAFTTLIFLLASLALAGRGRTEVLVIGALFTLGVFFTYLGVGLGLFAALRAASAISVVSIILRWLLFAVLIVFAVLSVYDYFKIRAGKASEILLQLPNSLKLKIHASIRNRAKTTALAFSSLGLGFLVSIFEFACTAQVYLPTLAYLARQKGRSDAIGLLVLYNLAFIAPLVVVFIASYLGVGSKRIATIFQKRMGAVKLGLAAVFIVLAVLTLLN